MLIQEISYASIFGEHGDSEFPVWSAAVIGDVLFKDYFETHNKENGKQQLQKIFEEVRDSAYEIINKKDETSYDIGLALTKISIAILKNQNSILLVSSLLEDYYGVSDTYLSGTAIVCRSGIRQVMEVNFNEADLKHFKALRQKIKRLSERLDSEYNLFLN
ncbi:MAG: hypothetical protein LBS81_05000 [Endomicrobium sp.]|jgi:L-lactate dehydrogenase|nr:hypothetical protein [Endomicrobium sp.]